MQGVARERSGTFVAVVGPSGAGKDTLMRLVRAELEGRDGFHFVRRVITRPVDAASEDHDTCSEATFTETVRRGDFALWWEAHGLRYGIPALVQARLAAGDTVIANLSRRALHDAAQRFGQVTVAHINARPDVLAARIKARGRETDIGAIRQRLAREADIHTPGCEIVEIDNSGDVDQATSRLLQALQRTRAAHETVS